jgi:hypothetical protein
MDGQRGGSPAEESRGHIGLDTLIAKNQQTGLPSPEKPVPISEGTKRLTTRSTRTPYHNPLLHPSFRAANRLFSRARTMPGTRSPYNTLKRLWLEFRRGQFC